VFTALYRHCTWPSTRPVHGCVDGRVHGRVRAVNTCIRPCIRPVGLKSDGTTGRRDRRRDTWRSIFHGPLCPVVVYVRRTHDGTLARGVVQATGQTMRHVSLSVVMWFVITFLANVNSRSRSLYAVARPSVCRLSVVCRLRPTQAIEIFGNISAALGVPSLFAPGPIRSPERIGQ